MLVEKERVAREVAEVRVRNQKKKLSLWEIKNQILEMKGILN